MSLVTIGPDVHYEDGRFVAYANGTLINSFENSQDAWNAARAAAFAPVDPVTAAIAALEARQAELGQVTTEADREAVRAVYAMPEPADT